MNMQVHSYAFFEPLLVRVEESNMHKDKPVAFIGNQLCFFEHSGTQPTIGDTVQVMITRPVWTRFEERTSIRGVLLTLVNPKVHIPVRVKFEHDEFIGAGEWFRCSYKNTGLIQPSHARYRAHLDKSPPVLDPFFCGMTGPVTGRDIWAWTTPDFDNPSYACEIVGVNSFEDTYWNHLVRK